MVWGHVVLLAGVGTVGMAVALGRCRGHRSLQVGRLVLGQCRLPSETARPSAREQRVPALARDGASEMTRLDRSDRYSSFVIREIVVLATLSTVNSTEHSC